MLLRARQIDFDGLDILAYGGGMISSALALLSAENAIKGRHTHPIVPIYDAILFVDMQVEPSWVMSQVYFVRDVCRQAGIPFFILPSTLYHDYNAKFGRKHVVSIPFWTVRPDGGHGVMPRNCTLDYKIKLMQNTIRWDILAYKKGGRTKPGDRKGHRIHLGFSVEEIRRAKTNPHKMYVNRFPLIEMGMTRADCYAYCRDVWDFDTKASSCVFCPYHTNYFYQHLKAHHPVQYEQAVDFDEMIAARQKDWIINSRLYVSSSRQRLRLLTPMQCRDPQTFAYSNTVVWNGF